MTLSTAREMRRRSSRALARGAAVAAIGIGALFGAAASAQADFGIVPGSFTATATDNAGSDLTQAGAHPNATTSFMLNTTTDRFGNVVPDGDIKDVKVDLPVGVVGNPTGASLCPMSDFSVTGINPACSSTSQVGVATIHLIYVPGEAPTPYLVPVYNLEPSRGEVAQFGFRFARNNVLITAKVRSDSDYGITALIKDIPGGVPVFGTSLTFWGVPAETAHDDQRFMPGAEFPGMNGRPGDPEWRPLPSNVTPRAFFSNPTECAGPPITRIAMTSWQRPHTWVTDEATSPVVTGCEKLLFEPSLSFQPELAAAATPSSYRVRLGFAQNGNPTGLDAPALRDAVVRLPPGVVVSPSSAYGLQGCAPEQIGLRALGDPTCPAASTIGTVSIRTPLLSEPLTGNVFLATPTRAQLLKIYLYARGSGVTVKLAGDINPDPLTGQLTAVFQNNPQMPVSDIELVFKGGPRAPLVNPRTCGPVAASSALTPWSSTVAAAPTSVFTVSADGRGAPCADPGFAAGFLAGTQNPLAGADTTFDLAFSRTDREQYLKDIDVSMPEGLTGRIANVNLCSDAAAANGTCDESSRIGSILTKAGPGTAPLELPGRAYMTGPYKGAPFGMSFVVPAIAGPFDLGLVVVRAAVHVDKRTAALRVVSDPLPTILEGIPLQIRTVKASIDRRGFMLNPTNCRSGRIAGTVGGQEGGAAAVAAKFRASDCGVLPFKPKMSLKVGARGRTKSEVTTPLDVTLSMTPGQANNRVVQVTLPRTLNTRVEVVNNRNACTPEQFSAERCPQSIGTASAITPLLRDPLRGEVYLVRNASRKLPDMVVALKGQVNIDLVGKIAITRDLRVQTTFDTVPDVPITKFRLQLVAGRRGAVGIVNNLCVARNAKSTVARLAFRGQNGKRVDRNQKMTIAGCGKKAPARRGSRRAGRSRKSGAKQKARS